MISLFNPNIDGIRGFFVRVPITYKKVEVSVLRRSTGEKESDSSEFEKLETETFCQAELYDLNKESHYHPKEELDVETPADSVCEVFVDHEIEGLSMSHFQVALYANSHIESGGYGNLIEPEVVYRYDPADY